MRDFRWKNRGLLVCGPLFLVLLVGCGVKEVAWQSAYGDEGCQQLWAETERIIHLAQVADPATVRVEGFPYLRSNRYLQGLAHKAAGAPERHYVLEQMRLLDLDKRLLEISRIPGNPLAALAGDHGDAPALLRDKLGRCSAQFLHEDQGRPGFFDEVSRGTDLDQDYSLWLRSVGLYPLTSLVVEYIAAKAQEEMIAPLSRPAAAGASGALLTFRPPAALPASGADLPELLRRSRSQPLLSLTLADQDLLALAHHFAPLLTIATGASQDRFGRIVRDQGAFAVDGGDAVVYYYFSQTFVQGIPALQINYAIWFPERTKPAPWFERGTLDGLNFRVTLDWQGQPIFVDVAFQCGCYHFVLCNDELVSGRLLDPKGFQPFVGGKIPARKQGERLQFTINSGWHQIGQVAAALPAPHQPTYRLLPYEGLESFADGNAVSSLFDKEGRVAGTNRLERFFLFPLGIPKVGAMRQRGRQPITLIGRAYLDDPFLFDNAFGYRAPLPGLAELLAAEAAGELDAAGSEDAGQGQEQQGRKIRDEF